MSRISPIAPFLSDDGVLLLDGGLATELEDRGHVLDTDLWSADLLLQRPEAIRDVHLAYLDAGADCIITSSYKASLEGFLAHGLSKEEARRALLRFDRPGDRSPRSPRRQGRDHERQASQTTHRRKYMFRAARAGQKRWLERMVNDGVKSREGTRSAGGDG